jgi:hypothetical protein
MAITAEQQSTIDVQEVVDNARQVRLMETETFRAKMEAIRLAKEVLIENNRNLPVGEREVTAAAITAYAATLIGFVNS